jgi:hypothetical protein
MRTINTVLYFLCVCRGETREFETCSMTEMSLAHEVYFVWAGLYISFTIRL